jgi:hypothetical protein
MNPPPSSQNVEGSGVEDWLLDSVPISKLWIAKLELL